MTTPEPAAENIIDVRNAGNQDRSVVQFLAASERAIGPGLVVLTRAHQPVRFFAETGDLPAERVVIKRDSPW